MKYTSLIVLVLVIFALNAHTPKIIGLMQVKNEETIVEFSLRALAQNVDEIIALDDASTDGTVAVLKSLTQELPIVEIIENKKSEWINGSEATNKQLLLNAGRRHGGTHFLAIDADEVLTTHCSEDQWLRNKVLSLKKGQILQIPLINLWKGFEYYRCSFTDKFPDICYCTIGYCDDGVSTLITNLKNSHSTFLHLGRFPHIARKNYPLFINESDLNRSIIHMPFVNWTNVVIKKIWIMMLEIIRLKENKVYNRSKFKNGRTVHDINGFYATFHNYETYAECSSTPRSWLNYPFFKKEPFLEKIPTEKLQQIKEWMKNYRLSYFAECDYIRDNINSIIGYCS